MYTIMAMFASHHDDMYTAPDRNLKQLKTKNPHRKFFV